MGLYVVKSQSFLRFWKFRTIKIQSPRIKRMKTWLKVFAMYKLAYWWLDGRNISSDLVDKHIWVLWKILQFNAIAYFNPHNFSDTTNLNPRQKFWKVFWTYFLFPISYSDIGGVFILGLSETKHNFEYWISKTVKRNREFYYFALFCQECWLTYWK